jgi:hypothetical protein
MMTGAFQTDHSLARTVPLPGSPLLELPSGALARPPAGRPVNRPRDRAFTRCPAPAPVPASTRNGRGANVCATLRFITSPRARAGCFPRSAIHYACSSPMAGTIYYHAVTGRVQMCARVPSRPRHLPPSLGEHIQHRDRIRVDAVDHTPVVAGVTNAQLMTPGTDSARVACATRRAAERGR